MYVRPMALNSYNSTRWIRPGVGHINGMDWTWARGEPILILLDPIVYEYLDLTVTRILTRFSEERTACSIMNW